jgi:hypothetical protein
MIKLENFETVGWEHAIRGMRNPMNSWEKSDSKFCIDSCDDCSNFPVCNVNFDPYFRKFWDENPANVDFAIGPNDHDLMMRLRNAGTDHRKFMRMVVVYVDITAPLYWWKEFDTYKVGTVANSCSTMHKLTEREFALEDFSCEKLFGRDYDSQCVVEETDSYYTNGPKDVLGIVVDMLNQCRLFYIETKDKVYWDQMIQLLPSSYNQKRTVMLNYEVLANIYKSRRNHKLDEWRELCWWIEGLPYSELITGEQL